MKHFLTTLFVLLGMGVSAFGQGLHGDWEGTLKLPMGSLKLVLHINLQGDTPSVTMDSPQQGAYSMQMQIDHLDTQSLKVAIPNLMMRYEATLGKDNKLQGTFEQGTTTMPLSFSRQEPRAAPRPLPNLREAKEVQFVSQDGSTQLSGTLSTPLARDRQVAILLIAGSGALDRDETIMGHKPFAVLSDSLVTAGFSTLRYDKRGVGKSQGDFRLATIDSFISDAIGGVAYLKSCGYKRIILAGHSEGGIIAGRIAHLRPQDITAILLLNAPIKPLKEGLIEQNEAIAKAHGSSPEQLSEVSRRNRVLYNLSADPNVSDETLAKRSMEELEGLLPPDLSHEQREQIKKQTTSQILLPSVRTLLRCQPLDDLRLVQCPILAIQSEQDLQVLASNADILQEVIPSAHIRRIPSTNHLMQPSTTGLPTEYASIQTTLATNAWEAILELLNLVPETFPQ